MKSIIIALFMIKLMSPWDVMSQCKLDVDSLFQSHFFSLDTTIQCGTYYPVISKDFAFVRLLAEISRINYKIHSYTGNPLLTVQDVLVYKKWYWKNKNKIDCNKVERLLLSFKKEREDDLLEQLINQGVENPLKELEKLK